MKEGLRVGFAVCGSFCTFHQVMPQVKRLVELGADVTPIMSEMAYATDTRFGRAEDFRWFLEDACGKKILHTIAEVEPIGPKGLLDVLVIAPCTGNTLAKMALGITDTPVCMAAKSHLRNRRPVVIAVSSNDALTGSAVNIGALMNRRNLYFVPFSQDDIVKKPASMVADMDRIPEAVEAALEGVQLQPVVFDR